MPHRLVDNTLVALLFAARSIPKQSFPPSSLGANTTMGLSRSGLPGVLAPTLPSDAQSIAVSHEPSARRMLFGWIRISNQLCPS